MAAAPCSSSALLPPKISKRHHPLGFRQLPAILNGASASFPADSSNLQCIQAFPRNKVSRRNLIAQATPDPEVANAFSFWSPDNNPWIAGAVGFMVTVPLLVQRLLTLTKGVDIAAETVEKIADTVQHVAEEVDNVAEDLGESLPEGSLKKFANSVENLAEETAKDAQKVEDLMDKIEELDDKVEAFITNVSKDNQVPKDGKSV